MDHLEHRDPHDGEVDLCDAVELPVLREGLDLGVNLGLVRETIYDTLDDDNDDNVTEVIATFNYDYGLIIDEPYTKKLKAEYPCWCGSKLCRGTLLAPKDDEPKKSKKSKKKNKSKSDKR